MKHIVLIIALAISLVGCATTENYEKTLNSWVGAKADELISVWGPPRKSSRLSDGGRVLEYFQSSSTVYYNTDLNTFHNIENACKTLFIVNANGIIARWRWQGNACRS